MNKQLIKISSLAEKTMSTKQIEQIKNFAEILIEWNTKINLISRKDIDNIFENHIAPSLTFFLFDMITDHDTKVVDIGSGGGFPGIVNAIMFTEKQFTLIDATQKKVNFLNIVIERLGLKNCHAVWGRIEELSKQPLYNRSFDICTSRGLTTLNKLIPYSLPYLNKSGIILALKGGDMNNEIKEIKKPSRYKITEFEMDSRFHYLERFKTLKIVEIERASSN